MTNKRKIIVLAAVLMVAVIFWPKSKPGASATATAKYVSPVYGDLEKTISATATVQPMNRLEMKPPIGGRVDKINVEEGQKVKVGDVLAIMSSTDRAALLDAARTQGDKAIAYWQEVYKSTPLIAPIDGEVIVRTVQPGQTVTTADAVLVLSDRLIVAAQIDETDIGRVREGQRAVVTLDAYPDIVVDAKVGHIYHESKTVNNVTIYQADIVPESVPEVFRSGMSADVKIIEQSKTHILLIPTEAVKHDNGGSYVTISKPKTKKPVKQTIETGVADDLNTEVVSGVGLEDKVLVMTQKYNPSKGGKSGTNPFMPMGGQRKSQGQGRPS